MLKFAFVLVLAASSAQAAETRFAIDPSVNLDSLKTAPLSQMPVNVQRDDRLYRLDASAVLRGTEMGKLFANATDYDDYVKFGMPDLTRSIVVERGPGDALFVFTDLSAFGQRSQHYLEVHTEPALEATGAGGEQRGIEWNLIPRRDPWTYPDAPDFDVFYGSWYMVDLGGGDVYVRYFVGAQPRTNLPEVLISHIVESSLKNGAVKVVQILGKLSQSP